MSVMISKRVVFAFTVVCGVVGWAWVRGGVLPDAQADSNAEKSVVVGVTLTLPASVIPDRMVGPEQKMTAEEFIASVKAGNGKMPGKVVKGSITVSVDQIDALLDSVGDPLAAAVNVPVIPATLGMRISSTGSVSFEVLGGSEGEVTRHVAYDTFPDGRDEYFIVEGSGYSARTSEFGTLRVTAPPSHDGLVLAIAGDSVSPNAKIVCREEPSGDRLCYVGIH